MDLNRKDTRPVKKIPDYLTDAEQDYLRTVFTQYCFEFPEYVRNPRPHALAAIARNLLEDHLIYTITSGSSKNHILDLGGNFYRHRKHNRHNVFTVIYDDNVDDIIRIKDRTRKVLSFRDKAPTSFKDPTPSDDTIQGNQDWLDHHVIPVKYNTPLTDYRDAKLGIMIHALYNNSPQDIYKIMVGYGLDQLFCTVNHYEEGQNMYCNTMQWEHFPGSNLWAQRDIKHGTSIYTHELHPNTYSNISYISGAAFYIKVEVYQQFGDQRVYLFTRVNRDRVTSTFDRKQTIYKDYVEELIEVPYIKEYVMGLPVYEYKQKKFKPNSIVIDRVGGIIINEHPNNPNVYEFAKDLISKINLKTIVIDSKHNIVIALGPEEIMEHAAYITHIHRRLIHTDFLLAQKTETHMKPLIHMSYFDLVKYGYQQTLHRLAKRLVFGHDWMNFQNQYRHLQASPYFNVKVNHVREAEFNIDEPSTHDREQPKPYDGTQIKRMTETEVGKHPEYQPIADNDVLNKFKNMAWDTMEMAAEGTDTIIEHAEHALNHVLPATEQIYTTTIENAGKYIEGVKRHAHNMSQYLNTNVDAITTIVKDQTTQYYMDNVQGFWIRSSLIMMSVWMTFLAITWASSMTMNQMIYASITIPLNMMWKSVFALLNRTILFSLALFKMLLITFFLKTSAYHLKLYTHKPSWENMENSSLTLENCWKVHSLISVSINEVISPYINIITCKCKELLQSATCLLKLRKDMDGLPNVQNIDQIHPDRLLTRVLTGIKHAIVPTLILDHPLLSKILLLDHLKVIIHFHILKYLADTLQDTIVNSTPVKNALLLNNLANYLALLLVIYYLKNSRNFLRVRVVLRLLKATLLSPKLPFTTLYALYQ